VGTAKKKLGEKGVLTDGSLTRCAQRQHHGITLLLGMRRIACSDTTFIQY